MFSQRKKSRKKSRIGVKTPNIRPIPSHNYLFCILRNAQSANTLRLAASHLFESHCFVLLSLPQNRKALYRRLGSAGDHGNIPDLHRPVVASGHRDSARCIEGRTPHVFPFVSLQNCHAHARFAPHADRAVFRRGEEKRGNQQTAPETHVRWW